MTITPAFPLSALVLIALGGLWIVIWRRRWRWLGLLPVLAGIVLALTSPSPDLMIAPDARTIALRGADGLLYFPRPPKDHYAAARWLLRDGDSRDWRDAAGGDSVPLRRIGLRCPAGRLDDRAGAAPRSAGRGLRQGRYRRERGVR